MLGKKGVDRPLDKNPTNRGGRAQKNGTLPPTVGFLPKHVPLIIYKRRSGNLIGLPQEY